MSGFCIPSSRAFLTSPRATIVGNPPDGSQKGVKTTLVVVPSSALKQWEEEIRRHVQEGFLKKMMHYKRSKEMSMANLEDQDLLSEFSVTC